MCISEHYLLWEKEFKNSLPSSTFGENLTLTNMLEKDICIGDIFRLGDAVIQITQGRIPCSTITKRTTRAQFFSKNYALSLCNVSVDEKMIYLYLGFNWFFLLTNVRSVL